MVQWDSLHSLRSQYIPSEVDFQSVINPKKDFKDRPIAVWVCWVLTNEDAEACEQETSPEDSQGRYILQHTTDRIHVMQAH